MPSYYDHLWHGTPEAVNAAIEGHTDVLGPRVLDGVAYVNVRASMQLPVPDGLEETGAQLSAAVLGVWLTAEEFV